MNIRPTAPFMGEQLRLTGATSMCFPEEGKTPAETHAIVVNDKRAVIQSQASFHHVQQIFCVD